MLTRYWLQALEKYNRYGLTQIMKSWRLCVLRIIPILSVPWCAWRFMSIVKRFLNNTSTRCSLRAKRSRRYSFECILQLSYNKRDCVVSGFRRILAMAESDARNFENDALDYPCSNSTFSISRLTFPVSNLLSHLSPFTFSVSRLTFHISHFTFHVSHFTTPPDCSRRQESS